MIDAPSIRLTERQADKILSALKTSCRHGADWRRGARLACRRCVHLQILQAAIDRYRRELEAES
jgi:hypothetical protein